MLQSELFKGDAELARVAGGTGAIRAPQRSEAVARVQQALLALGFGLPRGGVDEIFGDETGRAAVAFKEARGLVNLDPVLGGEAVRRLDLELAYLEGNPTAEALRDPSVLALDPIRAGLHELAHPVPVSTDPITTITDLIVGYHRSQDRMCLRLSYFLADPELQMFGKAFEPPIFEDYCMLRGPCDSLVYLDETGSGAYRRFLTRQHGSVPPDELAALARQRRPDILSLRPPPEWYEIKPASVSGAIQARIKLNSIPTSYARLHLPYLAGTAYDPTPDLPLLVAPLVMPAPGLEVVEVVLHVWRPGPGLVFYLVCLKGEYLKYLKRVGLAVGVLTILGLLAPELLGAAAGAAAVAAIAALLLRYGVEVPGFPTGEPPAVS